MTIFVPKLPLLATFILITKKYLRVELIRDIRAIYAANKNKKSGYDTLPGDAPNGHSRKAVTPNCAVHFGKSSAKKPKKLPAIAARSDP